MVESLRLHAARSSADVADGAGSRAGRGVLFMLGGDDGEAGELMIAPAENDVGIALTGAAVADTAAPPNGDGEGLLAAGEDDEA
jgi:hypothetical protein